ncbi:MAG TPA: DNA starvation/stationary phase protection protein, partial [Alphaproteobacteria bacterium]|nr:DNA starvation/stationary phase protection protein [Alphaproteobacteria bacterium]
MSHKLANSAVIEALEKALAGMYILALKTHGFHWNVEGRLFPQLHEMFSKQYEALFDAADEVAERLRALDKKAPASFAQFSKLTQVKEAHEAPPSAEAMLKELLGDYGTLSADLEHGVDVATRENDVDTADLLTGLLH